MRAPLFEKKAFMILLATFMTAILMLAGCGGTTEDAVEEEPVSQETVAEEPEEATEDEDLPIFTMDEIAEFDGQDGNPAYIVVDGLVYDVTKSGMWSGGVHQGQFRAGQDLTEEIMEDSPHGTGVLDRMEIVGQIAE